MIKEILCLCRNPYHYFHAGMTDTISTKMRVFKNSFIFCVCASFLIMLMVKLVIESIFNTSISQSQFINQNHFREVNTFTEGILKIGVLGPFEEEIRFRLILITRSYFLRVIILMGWIERFLPELFRVKFFTLKYYVSIIVVIVFLIIGDRFLADDHPIVFKREYFNYLFWGSTCVFAISHVGNFAPLNWTVFYLYPFYVLPQFVYGIILSYLTIRYNSILWPFLLHMAINLTSQIPRIIDFIID